MAQGRKLTANERSAFLRIFSHCGSVQDAAEQAGIGRATVYLLRQSDDGFEREFQAAMADFRRLASPDVLCRSMKLAIEGAEEYVTCKDGLVFDQSGKPVMQKRFFPAHTVRMLESLMPDTFGRKETQVRQIIPADLEPDPEPTPDEPGPDKPIL